MPSGLGQSRALWTRIIAPWFGSQPYTDKDGYTDDVGQQALVHQG